MNKIILGILGAIILAAVVIAAIQLHKKDIQTLCYERMTELERQSWDIVRTKDGNGGWWDLHKGIEPPRTTKLASNKFKYESSVIFYATSKSGAVRRYREFYTCEVTDGKASIVSAWITTKQI